MPTATGRVFDAGGKPISRARVRLLRQERIVDEQATDDGGRFRFLIAVHGKYSLWVEYPGYEPASVDILVNGSGLDDQSVHLRSRAASSSPGPEAVSILDYTVPGNARREFDRGMKLKTKEKCAEAIAHFEKAVDLSPRFASALNELGNCYVRLGNREEAEAVYRSAIEVESGIVSHMNLAGLYIEQKRYYDARTVLDRALRDHPEEGDAHYLQAVLFFQQGNIDRAEAAALEADSRRHRLADVHLLLAKIYSRRNNAEGVRKHLETYVKEAPNGPESKRARATLKQMRRSLSK